MGLGAVQEAVPAPHFVILKDSLGEQMIRNLEVLVDLGCRTAATAVILHAPLLEHTLKYVRDKNYKLGRKNLDHVSNTLGVPLTVL